MQGDLRPLLTPNTIVILDNGAAHKSAQFQHMVETKGAQWLCLPPYSLDLSPIEHAFSKIKQALRRAKRQTLDALSNAIARALDAISWSDSLGYFTHCGLTTWLSLREIHRNLLKCGQPSVEVFMA